MKTIFEEISLRSDEDVDKKSCWMLAELYQIVKFHLEAELSIECSRIVENFEGIALATQIGG